MSSILTNSSAMVALDTLRGINKNLAGVQSEISTGKKISSAVDNAAIWAISTVMSTDVDSFNQISDSLNLGSSTVGVARTASEDIVSRLQDLKTKIVSAQEENVDRSKIQTDIDELVAGIDSTVSGAQFNGQNLVSSSGSISILSSLDRDSSGNVTANTIGVDRVNLSQSAAVSTLADVTATDAGFASVSGLVADQITTATAATSTPSTATISFDGTGALTADDVFTVTIGNDTFTATAVAGDDLNDIGAALATAINNGGIAGYSAEFVAIDPDTDGASLVISNASIDPADQKSITVRAVDDAGDELAGVGAASVSGLEGSGDISADVTFAQGAILTDEEFTINVGGTDFTYTALAGDDLNDVGSGLAELINDAGDPKLSASYVTIDAATGDAVIQVAYDADDADDQVNVTSSTDSAGVTTPDVVTTGIGTISAAASVALDPAEASLTLNAGTVAAGDVFEFEVAGSTITYTAEAGDTLNTVANALVSDVNDLGGDITASFSDVVDPTSDDAVITLSNASTITAADFTLTQTQSATVTTEAGKLNGLGDLDVTTDEGAAAALTAIEGYLQSAIDASASFGSKQTRISNQVEFLSDLTDSLKTGIGALTDSNLEEASARLQSLQVQQQLGVQALSIANQGPQQLLALFR